MRIVFLLTLLLCGGLYAEDKPPMNINVAMMESTCKIVGNGSLGTGFIVGRPDPEKPDRAFYTLVTAHHVLSQTQGDLVTIALRRLNDSGDWERMEIPVQVRKDGKDLWRKHPDVDLAVIYVKLPEKAIATLIPMALLLTDQKISEFEISPGAELLCLGYPFGAEANSEGFPILRSGKIASYPLLPTRKTKSFLFDFTVFRGNSGGPVYLYDKAPIYGGSMHVGTIQGIMGVVTSERNVTQQTEQLYERRETVTPLALGEVIHASFIEELIESLPDHPPN